MLLKIYGVVQGVGFRPTVFRVAQSLGLRGYVKNAGRYVEVSIDRGHEKFIAALRAALPPLARIDRVEIDKSDRSAARRSVFSIMHSSAAGGAGHGPAIPSDTALCPDCMKDILSRANRRHMYAFTNCTDCGARYSVIRATPFDRRNTSMAPFPLCPECRREYENPADRRFHAQTISCSDDGPKYTLYGKNAKAIRSADPIKDFANKLDGGAIGVLKGWGGMHIVCTVAQAARLRKWYGRPQKPFAVMARDIDAARRYAEIGPETQALLSSPQRPIVLAPQKGSAAGRKMVDAVSPGLPSIGNYLPYAGTHHVLFSHLKSDCLIMTSANPKGEPMIIENRKAFSLGLDCYLLHNREIVNRIDDSVTIPRPGGAYYIRRSRGCVPQAIEAGHSRAVVSLGAEENICSAVSCAGLLYASQYIGDSSHYGVLEFERQATRHLMRLVGVNKPEAIGIDLHPQYATRRLGGEMAREHGAKLVEVQHHWAHAASLLADANIEGPLPVLALDGTGWGPDGTVWGGEVLIAGRKSYRRIGSLQPFPLIGGDAAAKDPRRLVLALQEASGSGVTYFRGTEREILLKLAKKSARTSSMGRLLDALSCRLGICETMTYDGEPAMKLERCLIEPVPTRKKPAMKNPFPCAATQRESPGIRVVQTVPLYAELEALLGKTRGRSSAARDGAAYYFVNEVIKSLAEIACDAAEDEGLKSVGITGGVSYNLPITAMFCDFVRARGLAPVLHSRVPNGDGGISTGQNVIVGNLI